MRRGDQYKMWWQLEWVREQLGVGGPASCLFIPVGLEKERPRNCSIEDSTDWQRRQLSTGLSRHYISRCCKSDACLPLPDVL